MSFTPEDFARLYATHRDPWGYERHWYESRKRALTLAMLTRRHYPRIFEPGCSIGVLSEALVERCDAFLGWDVSASAIDAAKRRLQGYPQARLECHALPEAWPQGRFDLIVFSELGYFLDRAGLRRVIEQVSRSLAPDGELLACHWRHPIEGGELGGDEVHRQLARQLGLPCLARHREKDLLLELWSRDERSPARREGLI
ncbi:class I SAM-dependent methyltransferase [Pistricoccus aurantiacus]|uniref:Class I SAM-dependent methyltransferase n=1 Tax=Pistricoccus aurantiacus TaxID=1883414 RepID=A0A5B8SQM5_9GAMM|nr:class I SAM-dependent methyltransferase [Pistricoccus aurantiacus]QEA38267.1 class I SAM-dependent methyltransferase [Pistricoccus aurantiacus]